jgi:HPt (histidine-containing phosphotransfer) domain-containing protein
MTFATMPPEEIKEYVSYEAAIRRFRGNAAIYKRLLESYLAENPYAEFCETLAAGDINSAERHAHSLKGVAGNMSLPALLEASTQADNELKQGAITAQTEQNLAQVMAKTTEYVTWLSENII